MKKKSKKEKTIYNPPEDSVEITLETITTVSQLQSFVKKLPKCHTISSRLTATKNLLEIRNNELYQKCIELKGLSYLSSWLKEYKKSVSGGTDLTRDEEFIVINIIDLCERIHLSINDLKISKIGKNINSLGKALPKGCNVRKHCEEIVSKWREMIDSNEGNEDNNEENVEENNQFLNNKIQRNNHNSIPLSFNNTSTNINPKSNNINLNTNVNNTSNKINSIKIKTAPTKSCLKKGNSNKKGLNVHFNDLNLIEVKIFKSTDEPNAPNISQEEYMKIQEEVRKNPHKFKIEEIRKKEVTMDINQQKEPEISWKFPPKIKLDAEIENEFLEHGKDSQQNKFIDELCASELKVYYFNEIPEPIEKEKEKKLYSFTDENIPKIENSQKATKTNDVTIADISKFWDNLGNDITKENLKQLEELLGKAIDIDNESKQQILEQAQKKYEQENLNNQNYLNPNNNININNNLTINNNQRILSMSNYPNLMNFNNLNQISGNALSLLNNVKPIQPNLDQINYLNQAQTQNNLTTQNNNFNKAKFPEMIQQTNTQNIANNIPNTIPNMPMTNIQNINYALDPNLNVINQLNNYQQQIQNNNINRNKSNIDQRMIMESAQRMNVAKYKTKPCRNYHSSMGCTRGDNCFFIHDPNYKGREILNFDPRNYERNFPLQIQGMIPGPMGIPQIPNLNPQIGNQIYQMQQMGLNPMNLGINIQQMMGLNQNMNKTGEGEMEQYNQNNMMNAGIIQNNIENNVGFNGINQCLSNNGGFINGINIPGYDYNNYNVGIQGQNMNNMNQNNAMIMNGMNSNQ